MSEKKLTLDFSDITSNSTQKSLSQSKIEEKKESKEENELKTDAIPIPKKTPKKVEVQTTKDPEDQFMLTIPQGSKEFKIISLEKCTGTEFLEWAKAVYPYVAEPAEAFNDFNARRQAMKHIISFHNKGLTWLRSQELQKQKVLH